jgi:hypothetical protein
MRINEVPELQNELKSIESVAELNPDAVYVFKFTEHLSQDALAHLHIAFGRLQEAYGIKAIIVDASVGAIYKLERQPEPLPGATTAFKPAKLECQKSLGADDFCSLPPSAIVHNDPGGHIFVPPASFLGL